MNIPIFPFNMKSTITLIARKRKKVLIARKRKKKEFKCFVPLSYDNE